MKRNRIMDVIPIYSPRTSYKKIKATDEKMMSDLTLNFDRLTINLLKDQFQKRGNSLNLQEFITITMKHLNFWQMDMPNREITLIRYLTFLFNEIDINGNQDMQWDEFTNYIIEKATVLKHLKSKKDEVKQFVRSPIKPKMKIQGLIHKVQYIKGMDRVAFCEEGGSKIWFMSLENGEINGKWLGINPKKLIVNISSVKKEKSGKVTIRNKDLVIPTDLRVLDMLYLHEPKYKVLLVSTSDGYVRGWKHGQNGFVVANQPDNEQQLFQHFFCAQIYCLSWDEINEILYCGQKSGSIYIWNLKTDLEKVLCEPMKDNENYNQNVDIMITTMITMPKLQFMASGRMDGKLILWDTINNKKKWVYKQHSRGILSLAFNESMILLFSAGFDHKICIWNPYISTLIHQIQGHLAPILSLKIIETSHQLISLDSEGVVKMTDTRRFNFIDSFSVNNLEEQKTSFSSFIVIEKPLKLLFAGKSLTIFDYDKNYSPFTADENTAICCKYLKDKLCFFTPMGNKIKIWSALNGDIERIYMEVTQHQISAFSFDFLRKRILIGDTKGNISLHNTSNGARMKSLVKHSAQITHLIALHHDCKDIFISTGLDNQIKICCETQESFEVLRTISFRKDTNITSVTYSEITKLIIVGSNVGNLSFYELETGKTAGYCYFNLNDEITSISKTSKGVIIATTSTGKISLIAIPPLPNRFQKLITFYHKDNQKPLNSIGIRLSCYSVELNYLYVVDDKMYLTCYSLKDIEDGLRNSLFSRQKVDSERKSALYRIFQSVNIIQKWQVKVHQEIVKSLEYIEGEELLVTTSFDKKVKIWSAQTGQLIDSLQQNYNKMQPSPLAYLDFQSKTLFSHNHKKFIELQNMLPVQCQFNPFIIEDIVNNTNDFIQKTISNKEWKVHVDFRNVVKREMQIFQQLSLDIQKKDTKKNLVRQAINIQQLKDTITEKRKIMKEILDYKEQLKESDILNLPSIECVIKNRRLSPEGNRILKRTYSNYEESDIMEQKNTLTKEEFSKTNDGFQKQKSAKVKRITNNYFKRSILTCIKKINEKKQIASQLTKRKIQIKPETTHYVPITKILKNSKQSAVDIQHHNRYMEKLYRQETQNIINSKSLTKIYMTKEEACAASKLCQILIATDSHDKRPKILYQSIQISNKKK